jgi:hypothetical protein
MTNVQAPAVALVVLILLGVWRDVQAHRLLHLHTSSAPAPTGPQQQNTGAAPAADDWPSEWPDVAIQIMSRGDLQARGGAMKALGRAKLQRIKAKSSVNLTVEALAAKLDKEKELVSHQKCRLMLAGVVLAHRSGHCCLCCCSSLALPSWQVPSQTSLAMPHFVRPLVFTKLFFFAAVC